MKISVLTIENCKIREVYRDAAKFYLSTLIPDKRRTRHIEVVIKITTLYDYGAFVERDAIKRNRFIISLDERISLKTRLVSLAHEMVHVKQGILGELGMSKTLFNGRYTQWKGEWLLEKSIDYWDHPWEIEAYGKELGLYERFRATVNAKAR